MKREILKTATINQGRTHMSPQEMRQFLNALGFRPRQGKAATFEIRLESEVYLDDDDDEVYALNWRVKSE